MYVHIFHLVNPLWFLSCPTTWLDGLWRDVSIVNRRFPSCMQVTFKRSYLPTQGYLMLCPLAILRARRAAAP
jgi:hypothetical protein